MEQESTGTLHKLEGAPVTNEALEEMSAIELNERLISLPIFSCKKCGGFLNPPIMLIMGVGNVCGSCSTCNSSTTVIHNSALEIILQNLAIPCRNTGRGCTEKLDYFSISNHDSVCVSRSYYCPMKFFDGCTWEGSSSALLDHSLGKHPEFAISGNGTSFKLDIDISVTNELVKLLYTDSEKFILHAKCDTDAQKLWYIIYYVGNIEKACDFSYTVKQMGCVGISSCSLNHGSYDVLLHDLDFTCNFDSTRALAIDLVLVKQLVRQSTVATLIQIQSKTHNSEELDHKLLNYFECPICNYFMKPPIFQCLAGHSLCNRCRLKLGQCPTCRAGFGNTRNFTLETLSSGIRYPCIYRDLGCHTVLPVADINQHESECSLRPYNCPFNEFLSCAWEGSHSKIATHLKNQHADRTRFTNYIRATAQFSFDTNFSELCCVVVYEEVFRICYRRDMGNHNNYWSVQLVGPRDDARKYKCEVGLIDGRNELRKLVRIDFCQDLTNHDNMFNNQCIMLPTNLTSGFSCNNYITYYIKINKAVVSN